MAITSKGFTGTVTQTDWAAIMDASAGSGLTGTFNGTGFSAAPSGTRQLTVQPGTLLASGVHVTMDASAATTGSSANSSGLPRIDLLVMRVNWSSGAAALAVIEGTPNGAPQAPTFNKTPGTVEDIPLYEARLNPSVSTYTNLFSRRYWLQDGLYAVPEGTRLPDMPAGRLAVVPGDEGGVLVGRGDGQPADELRRWRDSGWLPNSIVAAPNGFGGSVKGRLMNGWVMLQFNWTKLLTGTGTNATFSSAPLPVGWWPGGGVDISTDIWAGPTKARIYISASTGGMGFGPLTMAEGQSINGLVTFTNLAQPTNPN
jgi:hypothetical protein